MDSITVTLKGQPYVLRFTIPRLRQLAQRTQSIANPVGVGLLQLTQAAVLRNYDAIVMLLWAGLAHPDNPGLKDATQEDVEQLITLGDAQPIIDAITALIKMEFPKKAVNGAPDPQQPTAPN